MVMTREFSASDPDLGLRMLALNVRPNDIKLIQSQPEFGKETIRLFSLPNFFGDSHSIAIHPGGPNE